MKKGLIILASFIFIFPFFSPSLLKAATLWTSFTTTNSPLSADYINGITQDAARRKWIATYGGGFNVLDDNGTPADKFDDQWQNFSSHDRSDFFDITYTVAIDGAGIKWIGGHGYALFILNDNGSPFNKSDDQWDEFVYDGFGDRINITGTFK